MELLRPEFPSNYTFYTESASVGIFLGIGLLANVPLIFVYVRSKHNRSVCDKFLFNILITDALSLIILLPMILLDLIVNHKAEESISSIEALRDASSLDLPSSWSCTLKKSLLSGVATASILAALEIAVERYLVIVTPLHYHKLLTRPAVIITSCIGVIIAIGSAMLSSLDPCEPVFPSCAKTTINYTDSLWWPMYTLLHVTIFFILPVLLMACIYLKIWCEARRQIAKINEQCKNPFFVSDHRQIKEHGEKGMRRVLHFPMELKAKIGNRLKAARMDRAARASIFTLSATIICWSPYYYVQCAHAIRSIMEQMGGTLKVVEDWNHWETTLPLIFASLHPVVEPFLYAYRYKRLREEVKKMLRLNIIFRCIFRAKRHNDEQPFAKCQCPTQICISPETKPISKICQPMLLWGEDRPRFHIGDLGSDSSDVGLPEIHGVIPDPCCEPGANQHNSSSDLGVNLDERLSDTIRLKSSLHWIGNATRQIIHCISDLVHSYSIRWRNHRESVTSTSSVVTLISSRCCPEVPVNEV